MINYAGNTPMADITYKYEGKIGHVYAKLEYYNPSGSIKDRIAAYILNAAKEQGLLKAGQPIIETSSGNTGIALAAYGALTKHPVHIYMPDWASEERVKLMKMYGAEVHLISREEGGFTSALLRSDELANEIGGFKVQQFSNTNNSAAHYNGTAAEILKQLPDVGAFVSGVGSGGTIMGVGSRLIKENRAKLIAIEPDCAQILAGQEESSRQHKIEGIGDDFIPELMDTGIVDSILPVNDDDAIAMSAKLARELGLGVGISSGANFLGAVLASMKYPEIKIASVFADDNKKYLSTELGKSPLPKAGMLSEQIELLDVKRID